MNQTLRIQKIDLLLKAAAKVFYVQGFHGTKMIHVAKEAKVSKGVLYFYFTNKEDLYMALVHDCILKVDNYKELLLNSVKEQNGKDQILVFLEFYLLKPQNQCHVPKM